MKTICKHEHIGWFTGLDTPQTCDTCHKTIPEILAHQAREICESLENMKQENFDAMVGGSPDLNFDDGVDQAIERIKKEWEV